MGTLPHLNLESGTPPYRRWSLGIKIKHTKNRINDTKGIGLLYHF